MTIYDLAKITGYSSATVARALSGRGYCGKKTKEAIQEAAKKAHYNFNSQAQALRSNKTNKILCCIPDICNPFYFLMIKGITEVLEKNHYILMLYPTDKKIEKELEAINLCESKFADGIIMISFDFCKKNIEAIRRSKIPTVLGNEWLGQKPDDNFDYIYVDHTHGMGLATEHLIKKGCKNILLVTGNLKEQTSYERSLGYIKALKDNGMEPSSDYMIDGGYEKKKSEEALNSFIASNKPFDGIIAANDLSAFGVLTSLRDHNIGIPDPIKLVSFDNTDYATVASPSLTSIDMCQYELGECLAQTLLERLKGRHYVKNTVLEPRLIERQSS